MKNLIIKTLLIVLLSTSSLAAQPSPAPLTFNQKINLIEKNVDRLQAQLDDALQNNQITEKELDGVSGELNDANIAKADLQTKIDDQTKALDQSQKDVQTWKQKQEEALAKVNYWRKLFAIEAAVLILFLGAIALKFAIKFGLL